MKHILGLDLGTNSIGWALVEEAENKSETSKIIKLGVRVNPLTSEQLTDFEKGKPLTINAERTLRRGARRNLQRFKQRRSHLITVLQENKLITKDSLLTEIGKKTTYQTLSLRAKAAREQIALEDLAKVFLMLNKKRGYKSSRKATNQEDGVAIDGMAIAKELYDNGLTPGQYVSSILEKTADKKSVYIPEFYPSDLQAEFLAVWQFQKQFYPELLQDSLYQELQGKNKTQTWATCKTPFALEGISLKGKAKEVKKLKYRLRVSALQEKIDLEHLAIVLQEINNSLKNSSGYLGAISDRSKNLYFNKQTIGEYLYAQIQNNPHTSLKNQVFYRQDYLDEFEQIWKIQAVFYPEILTSALKEKIRDTIIFYQRKLKSQKGQISFCQFESWQKTAKDASGNIKINRVTKKPKTITVGQRVIPRSSLLFQEFKIWQTINNLVFYNKNTGKYISVNELEKNIIEEIFQELNLRGTLKTTDILKILKKHLTVDVDRLSDWKANYEKIEGNTTNKALFNVYQVIAQEAGYGFDWEKKTAVQIKEELRAILPELGITPTILDFDATIAGNNFDKQDSYRLWHLLYAAEDDATPVSTADAHIYGKSNVSLKKALHTRFGFSPKYAALLAGVPLQKDYGSLSARAIKKIIPHLQDGLEFSKACALAGYNHSNSLTKEELANRPLKDTLELLPKNSLRNPVVEKILNQTVNLVNQIITTYGKPDAVRIELARELKKTAKERELMTKSITEATKRNEAIKKTITKDFGIVNPTKTDITRYRLWQELLSSNGYKTIFTNKQIKKEQLFSKHIDIEHIIPKAVLFDDSFSNKTLAFKDVNLKKSNRTAFDFISQEYHNNLEDYIARVEELHKKKQISTGKYKKLLMPLDKLPTDFVERDLRNSQYIAKKAKAMLFEVFKEVSTTSGSITDRLRKDWDLINVMKELNFPKYKDLGLTQTEKRWDSGRETTKEVEVITNWTKRNDHRHHAMDALTVAFTTPSHVQYINNLNARKDQKHKRYGAIKGIEDAITHHVGKDNKKRAFIPPMPHFRAVAKKHIEDILISFKNKNKVVTRNINIIKTKNGICKKIQTTPRGQLHKETIYGKIKRPSKKATKLNKNFNLEKARQIVNPVHKDLVIKHLQAFDANASIAFTAKTLKATPLLYKNEPLKEVVCYEDIYTTRKPIDKDLSLDKVVDKKIQTILKDRLKAYNNNAKEAFSNLEENPIWLNKDKGISIKRVTITGVTNVEALHTKKDHLGKEILNEAGEKQAVDFVSTGNNHHVAIYKDTKGNLQEKVVSFYEAVARANEGLAVIDKKYNTDLGWEFLFTMKQNEMFVFPNPDFDIHEIDLLDPNNASLISKHLFRVQKISTKNYMFTHHLETQTTTSEDLKKRKMLSKKKYHSIRTPENLKGIVKVRINNIGKIVQVNEY